MPTFSTKTIVLKSIAFYGSFFLGGYLLWIKSLPIFLAYSIILIVTIIGLRYPVCGSCPYYGKPCPSYGFSYLATIFPKVEGKPFNSKAAMIETALMSLCWLMPILIMVLSWPDVINSYSLLEYVLTGIYVILILGVSIAHVVTGCNKCGIKDCPMNKLFKCS